MTVHAFKPLGWTFVAGLLAALSMNLSAPMTGSLSAASDAHTQTTHAAPYAHLTKVNIHEMESLQEHFMHAGWPDVQVQMIVVEGVVLR